MEFGLNELPVAPGVLMIRGPRQCGKSTWLEGALRDTIAQYGRGTALYLTGDGIEDEARLGHELERLAGAFARNAPVRRLFIDEISGGSPLACGALIRSGRIPEWVIEAVRDWIEGEVARAGRHRSTLLSIMRELHRHGGRPIGQTKLAKEAGLANNTVAAGWIARRPCAGCSTRGRWCPERKNRRALRRQPVDLARL